MIWFRRINSLALLLCFCVVVLGAFVRLSDAGLGCPDWPGCYGHITVPDADHEVQAAEARFPDRPVEAHKAWKEMVHRYFASTLGLLIVALAAISLLRRKPGIPRVLPLALVALVIFQGLLGMWTVTWLLKPLVVTGHLIGGMTTLALLLWLRLSVRPGPGTRDPGPGDALPPKGLRTVAAVALVVLACQIFLGGWTSTNYAALACPDFPTCQLKMLPELDLKGAFTLWHGLGINYEYGVLDNRQRVTIHFIHRVGAVIVALAFALLALFLLLRGSGRWRRLGALVLAAVLLQLTIGISIVMLHLPLGLATAHNAGAAILLLVTVALNFFARDAGRQKP